jgi:tripartite-type tricarboxylate transporter receptor subunit TctC
MPGAEGIKAANYLYAVAPRDGSVIGGLQRNTGLVKFYYPDNSGVQFDARKFIWLGSTQQEIGFFLLRTATGVKGVEGLRAKEVTISSTARTSPSSIYGRILNELFGTKIRVIEGYEGSQAALMAVERGEVDGHISGGTSAAFRARYRPWEKAGEVAVIMQLGMERDKEYPDAPTALDLAPNPAARSIFEIAFVEQVMGRPFVLPPDTPKDRAEVLRRAFDETMKDPALLEEAAKLGAEIDPVTGERINELLDKVYSAPADLTQRVRDLVQ